MIDCKPLPLFRCFTAGTRKTARHVTVGERLIPYELIQGRRRLSLTVDDRGLRVGAPGHVPLTGIETFIRHHGAWVLERLDAYAAHGHRHPSPLFDGARLPLLGGEVEVRLTSGGNRFHWQEGRLVLALREGADVDRLARRALQRRALDHFAVRVAHYAGCLGRPVPRLALSSARTRWGSCSRKTGVRLNWRLIHFPSGLVDYVVVHELAHLLEMNHGPRFWAVVEGLYPDWRAARAELRQRTVLAVF